jgi:hypothetical protein
MMDDYLSNWFLLIVVLTYVLAKFVLPGGILTYLALRLGRWMRDRYLWMRWFSL